MTTPLATDDAVVITIEPRNEEDVLTVQVVHGIAIEKNSSIVNIYLPICSETVFFVYEFVLF